MRTERVLGRGPPRMGAIETGLGLEDALEAWDSGPHL